MNKVLFFSAGEISGDIHAANLIMALKNLDKDIEFVGNGGKNMVKTGLKIIYKDMVSYSTVGLTDSLRFLKFHKENWKFTTEYLKNNKVDAVILVDHQGFNIPLAKFCKKNKIKVYYYFPPHVSIWGKWNAKKLPKFLDGLFVPFFDDYLIYKKFTSKVYYYGHPIVENIEKFELNKDFFEKYNIEKNKQIIGIFPGSRYQEIEGLTKIMLDAAKLISKEFDIHFVISSAYPVFTDYISSMVEKSGLTNVSVVQNESYSIMKISKVIIAASGTTTLEASLFEKPVVICYKISNLSFFIGKMLVRKKMIGMPNIIFGEKFLPELLQKNCNENKIYKKTVEFLKISEQEKIKLNNFFRILKEKVGKPPIIEKIASKIYEETFNG